jgi:protein SCO1
MLRLKRTRSNGQSPVRHQIRQLALAALVCLLLGALGGLIAATVGRGSSPTTRFIPPPEPARDFNLRNQDGHRTTLAQGRGKVIILTFLYSTCRDLCPAQAADIIGAIGRLGDRAGGLLVYGVSVDPVGDTPRRARAFLKKYGVYGGPVHYLVGTRAELSPVWHNYGIVPINATRQDARAAAIAYDRLQRGRQTAGPPYRPPERSAPPAAQEPYPDTDDLRFRGRSRHNRGLDFEHSAYVMLIDKHGRQRVGIPFEQLSPRSLAADLAILLAEA